jgi:hypothetical protein
LFGIWQFFLNNPSLAVNKKGEEMKNLTLTALFLLGAFVATEVLSLTHEQYLNRGHSIPQQQYNHEDERYAQHFNERFDRDSDGKVSKSELLSSQEYKPKPYNGNDFIKKYRAASQRGENLMRGLDANRDGFIDKNETMNHHYFSRKYPTL